MNVSAKIILLFAHHSKRGSNKKRSVGIKANKASGTKLKLQ